MINKTMTLDEAVEFLGTSRPTFYRWLHEGKLRGSRIGRKWQFQRSELEVLLQPIDEVSQALGREFREAIGFYQARLTGGTHE